MHQMEHGTSFADLHLSSNFKETVFDLILPHTHNQIGPERKTAVGRIDKTLECQRVLELCTSAQENKRMLLK